MTEVHLRGEFASLFPELSRPWTPTLPPAAQEPAYVAVNHDLGAELGLDADWLTGSEALSVLGARRVLPGSTPVAQAYAGHQFGGYSPVLGDGRAVLLGELTDHAGRTVDLGLKGSGPTPFARRGDGRAVIGPVLREYLFGESMHALGVPTTRVLAAVTTGDRVWRDGRMPPGAVLARVAASHLRVGTFELARQVAPEDRASELVPRLVEHALARHYPQHRDADNPALALLSAVIAAQAETIAGWMALGFVHGVMNTDNMALSGQTIDYGPCAWLEAFDPEVVFSSIDTGGRYRFRNQPAIGVWNLSRFAETLLPQLDETPDVAVGIATSALEAYAPAHQDFWLDLMRAKLGLPGRAEADAELIGELLDLLRDGRIEYTGFWRELARELGVTAAGGTPDPESFAARHPQWWERWLGRLGGGDRRATAAAMDAVNPAYVPRNHLVEEAVTAGEQGDFAPFTDLLAALTDPFVERPEHARYAAPAPEGFAAGHVTYCGT